MSFSSNLQLFLSKSSIFVLQRTLFSLKPRSSIGRIFLFKYRKTTCFLDLVNPNYQFYNHNPLKIEDIYQKELNLVRQNTDLLDNYRFEKDASNPKHFERLRLNIAIYNDMKASDYEIVRFLFSQEKQWRICCKEGEVDNLYFCAFVLIQFKNPAVILDFIETKIIDMDSGIGFDSEYLLAAGIAKTYTFMTIVENATKRKIQNYIGDSVETCNFSENDIDLWKASTKQYFSSFQYPIQDLTSFLYETRQKDLFLEAFPAWIASQQSWNYQNLGLYRLYAKYSENKKTQIEATKCSIEKNDKAFLTDIYKKELAELYIDDLDFENAFETLRQVINQTDNANISRDCVVQLSRMVFADEPFKNAITKTIYEVIKREQIKRNYWSLQVDVLIDKVDETYQKSLVFKEDKSGFPSTLKAVWDKFFKK